MDSEIMEITVPIPENRLTKQTIKFAEFKKDVDGNSLETVKLKNLLENQDQKRFDNEIIHFIDTTEVTKFSKPGYESFTFKVKTKFNGGFDNLVIVKTEHSVKELIIKYTPSQGWTSSSSRPYTGEVEYLSKKNLTKNPGCVLFIEAVYSRCSAGNNHPPDGSGGVCTVGYGSLIGYNIYEGSGCSGGGGSTGGDGGFGGPGGPSGGPSGSGGGLGGPNPNDPDSNNDTIDGDDIITVPMMRLNTIGMLQDLLNLGSSTTPEMQWLLNQSSNEQMVDIFNFIETQYESPESKAFAKEAINAFLECGEVDFENKLIYNPQIAQNYRASMSDTEEAIFNSLSTLQKEGYLRAATQAYIYAESHFPQPVRNRKGDAFKHTFWNALSTVYIGETLTEQLTTAHEDINYDPNYPNHYKETQMDLHNNSQGRQIAYGAGKLYQLVQDALDEGDLRYLNNLELSGGFWKATDNSQLTPTNQ